ALLAYFNHHALPVEFASDKILPYFISQAFPSGAVGLVIAAILAASLSSVDSAINSCTSVAMVDVYGRFMRDRRRPSDHAAGRGAADVRMSRMVTAGFGL